MIKTEQFNDLELHVIHGPLKTERENRIIESASGLLLDILPRKKALDDETAKCALSDGGENYQWMVAQQGDATRALAVYDTVRIPWNKCFINIFWYLVADKGFRPEAEMMFGRVMDSFEKRSKGLEIVGTFVDDVPNNKRVFLKNGFVLSPFKVHVPSLVDGKESEIAGSVDLLIKPSPEYHRGIPLHLIKNIVWGYLRDGYASPMHADPYRETVKSIKSCVENPNNRNSLIKF